MGKLILHTECGLYERNGMACYSTRQVATEFNKRHDNVLQSYDDMVSTAYKVEEQEEGAALKNQVSVQFLKDNFFENKYKDASGKMAREVLMTRNGSSVLVMGFTGKKALNFKIALMNRFDHMEQFIASLSTAKLEHPAFTQAIMDVHETPKHYHFSNEADMINRIVLGMSAKQYREERGLDKGVSIRPYLSIEEIQAIESLQRVDIGLLFAIPEYEARKQALTSIHERSKLKRIA